MANLTVEVNDGMHKAKLDAGEGRYAHSDPGPSAFAASLQAIQIGRYNHWITEDEARELTQRALTD